jgi:predicted nucleic acid-binding protein
MNQSLLEQVILVDTSAIMALEDPQDDFHQQAERFFTTTTGVIWASMNATQHEAYTLLRRRLGFARAMRTYDFLVGSTVHQVTFIPADEPAARNQLVRFSEHELSFHDALLATVMKRMGIYRTFAFDHHFRFFGFEVLPGPTR